MNHLYLKLEVIGGSSLKEIAEELSQIANKFDMTSTVNFNGTKLIATPGINHSSIIEQYERKIENSE